MLVAASFYFSLLDFDSGLDSDFAALGSGFDSVFPSDLDSVFLESEFSVALASDFSDEAESELPASPDVPLRA